MAMGRYNDDDVFAEDDDSEIRDREWRRMEQAMLKEGFRKGHCEGHEKCLQHGFNEGYQQSASLIYQLARMRGVISALIGHHLTEGESIISKDMNSTLQTLLDELSELEQEYLRILGQFPGEQKKLSPCSENLPSFSISTPQEPSSSSGTPVECKDILKSELFGASQTSNSSGLLPIDYSFKSRSSQVDSKLVQLKVNFNQCLKQLKMDSLCM